MPVPETLCVYQFKVVLRGISPMVWRRLLLRSDHSIADLHYTIQIAMGWSDSHLHRFHIHGKDYGVAHEGGLTFSDDPDRVWLAQFGFRLRERFLYEYDFYDNWKHDIRLEKVLPLSSKRVFPLCTGGQRPVPLGWPGQNGIRSLALSLTVMTKSKTTFLYYSKILVAPMTHRSGMPCATRAIRFDQVRRN